MIQVNYQYTIQIDHKKVPHPLLFLPKKYSVNWSKHKITKKGIRFAVNKAELFFFKSELAKQLFHPCILRRFDHVL